MRAGSGRDRVARLRGKARTRLVDLASGSLVQAQAHGRDDRLTDLVVAALLEKVGPANLQDPVRVAGLLRDLLGPMAFEVVEIDVPSRSAPPDAENRFNTLLQQLREGAPSFSAADAVWLSQVVDQFVGDRTPHGYPGWAADVGLDFIRSSSFANKGRLLATVVRVMRAQSVIELGTGYGMSALFLDAALCRQGRVSTVEVSRPQVPLATELFKEHCNGRVTLYDGLIAEVAPRLISEQPVADLLFHDAGHNGDQYVADFALIEPHLRSGATVLFDDIWWDDPAFSDREGPSHTHDGWLRVTQHPRVARSVEVNRAYGLLLLT